MTSHRDRPRQSGQMIALFALVLTVIVLVVGLLIPLLLLYSAFVGFQARRAAPREAWPMLVIAITAFVARAALYLG